MSDKKRIDMSDVVIGPGKLSGKAVYAARDFNKGEIVLKLSLKPITFQQLKALSPEEYSATHNHNGQIYIYGQPERYINHSETPNVAFDPSQQADVALQNIKSGEPITVNARYDDIPVLKKINALLVKVPNIEQGLDFYREQLGLPTFWKKEDIASVHLGDGQLVLSTTLDPETNILVESVDHAIDAFVKAGGKVITPPEDIEVGRLAVVADPFGNQLTILDFSKGFYKVDGSKKVIGLEGSK